MKKNIFFVVLWLLVIPWLSVFAQSTNSPKDTTDIKEIKARYCNDPTNPNARSLFIDTKTDVSSEICIDFVNTSNKTAHIGINFVDATVTNDESQNKACLPEWSKENFWKYVSNYPENVTIKPNDRTRITASINFSWWYAWASYGCLTFHSLDEVQKSEGVSDNMFTIMSRVGSFIDAFVDWKFVINLSSSNITSDLIKNLGKNPNFFVYRLSSKRSDFFKKDFRTYNIQRNVKNTGNIGISWDVQLVISNRYIVRVKKQTSDQIFLPWQVRSFKARIPRYMAWVLGWPVSIKWTIDYSPIYLWSTASEQAPQYLVIKDKATHFFFPRLFVIIGITLAILRRHKLIACYKRNTLYYKRRYKS